MDPKERFYRHFQGSASALQDQIKQLSSFSVVGGERQDAIEHVLAGISRLSNEVADASEYIPAYDQRTYSQAIKALTEQLNTVTSELAPKSRFQFKPRVTAVSVDPRNDPRHILTAPNAGASISASAPAAEQRDSVGDLPSFTKNYNEEMARPGSSAIRKPSFSSARDIAISDQTGLHIILPSTAARAASAGSLTGLKRCIVDMSFPTAGSAPFASLALKNIEKSLIVAGRVDGPAHITGVKDGIIVVAARQVRIHECRNVDIYLLCTSHPIIEDSSGLRFAPIPAAYTTVQDDLSKNQWDQVNDFNWPTAGQSPNWSTLPEEERLPDDIWRTTVPGSPGESFEDILKKVGIAR